MNLWLSSHFLVAGLFLSSSALTPEECQPLITPLSLADPSMMFGRWNFIVGYTDNEVHNDMLKQTESMWITVTPSPSSPNTVVMSQGNKLNGSCLSSKFNLTIDGNTASMSFFGSTTTFHILPSFDGFIVFSGNSTIINMDKILNMMKINNNATSEEVNFHAVYLMERENATKPDLEHFNQQANCLSFNREPDFIYDPKNGFCAEGEGHKIFLN